MKKMLIYVSLIGIATGVIYLLSKKEKSEKDVSKSDVNKANIITNTAKEEHINETNVMEEVYQAKFESAQKVHQRHSEAAEIMADAYKNIFRELDPIVFHEENGDIVIDNESATVMKELDLISDDLDDLLK